MPSYSLPPHLSERRLPSDLSSLTPRQRVAVEIRLQHPHLNHEEIGEAMGGISRQAVHKLLKGAMKRKGKKRGERQGKGKKGRSEE